jgi:hypothetical protein
MVIGNCDVKTFPLINEEHELHIFVSLGTFFSSNYFQVDKDLSDLAIGTPYPNLAHVSLGFEGVGYRLVLVS